MQQQEQREPERREQAPGGTLQADVLVIGAGPAGSTVAACLAEAGHDVVCLERARFPRYHVGESLIPYCWYPLERLGLNEKLAASDFVVAKHSVQFVSVEGELSQPFYFADHDDHPSSRTWQVTRGEFDQLLVANAREKGARVLEETAVKELRWEGAAVVGARAEGADGRSLEVRARMTVDASGRDALAQARNRWRVPDEELRKVAVWSYYQGGRRAGGRDEGATTIAYLPEKGWFWYLPLANDVVSVGVVAEPDYLFREGRDLEAVLAREIGRQPWVRDHLGSARRIEDVRATSEFTYRSRHCATDGLVLVGDAFGFLDPVFSSGVFLALQGGVLAADAVDAALRAGDVSARRFEEFGDRVREGMEAMRGLVHAFYDEAFNFGEFLARHPDHRGAVTDVLIGNLFEDFGSFFDDVRAFADLPAPLPHGRPLLVE